MTETQESAMLQLRNSTREEHQRAENHPFQQALVRGELSRDRYEAWLGQMYLVHAALEAALREAAERDDTVAKVVREYQYQLPYLQEDLEFFGVDPASLEPLPATRSFTSAVEETKQDPLFLLGLHYVLEGSNNGGRFIARHVGKAYDLAPGAGLRYLDPYGDRQREYWGAFKEEMGSVEFSQADADRLVEAAKQMYQSVAELSGDLASTP